MLDPDHTLIQARFYRDSCLKYDGCFVKDLRVFCNNQTENIGDRASVPLMSLIDETTFSDEAPISPKKIYPWCDGFDLSRVAIVDNSVMAFRMQLNNGVPIVNFYGGAGV